MIPFSTGSSNHCPDRPRWLFLPGIFITSWINYVVETFGYDYVQNSLGGHSFLYGKKSNNIYYTGAAHTVDVSKANFYMETSYSNAALAPLPLAS